MSSSKEDRFQLFDEVGTGGFGVVYRARDRLDGSWVAVKMLRSGDATTGARFDREAQVLAEIRHPSIVRYVAHGRSSTGQGFLAMEWLEGFTLEQRLRSGPLSVAEVLILARRVIEGFLLAGRRGVVHRDVKPANLFLVSGHVAETKILDFGLARRVGEEQSLTQTGVPIGTPRYMSPEQARGEADIDGRTDVFSLGLVLYECLTGVAPFAGLNALATLGKICFDEPQRVETLRPGIPVQLAALIHGMLAKKAAARPPFARIAEELQRLDQAATPFMATADALASTMEVALPQVVTSLRPSLAPRGQQRVLCAVFVGRPESTQSVSEEVDQKLVRAVESYGARCERLLDGSRILLFDRQLAPSEQAVLAAYCALSIGQLLPTAPIVLCTGRALLESRLPIGELFEQAAMLLSETAPGGVRVDETSAGLLDARFEIRGSAAERLLVCERVGGEAPRTLLGNVTPFVGRERELSQLEMVLRECVDESVSRAVLVTAPAGAGKSRLRHELVQRLRSSHEPFTLFIGRGDSVRAGAPFGVLVPALRAWAQIAAHDPLELKREKLLMRAEASLPADRAPRVAAFLGEMIGVPFPDEHSPHLAAARRDPQFMGDHFLECFLACLEAECREGPVLFLVEDLHWSDPASVRFLEAALRTLHDARFMLVAFARPEVRETFPSLWAERDLIEIRLPKLSTRVCERLLDSIAATELSPATRTWVVDRAEGNPFFLEELVRSLKVNREDRRVPDTIVGIIQARLDTLGEDAKLLLRAASILGQVFRIEAVEALLSDALGRLDVPGWLRHLTERELVFPRGAPGEREYVFRHALIRDAAYALLPEDERQLGHRLAAEWLEKQSNLEPALLAEHFEQGGARARAARWYAVAAKQALEAGSLEAVVRFGECAMSNGLADTALGEIASIVAEALSYAGNDADAAQWAEAARDNAEPGGGDWWRGTQVFAISALRQGAFGKAAALVAQMVEYTQAAPSSAEHVIALAFVAANCYAAGQHDLGEQLFRRLPEQVGDELGARTQGCVHMTWSLRARFTGELGKVLAHRRQALEAFRRAGAVRDIAQCLLAVGTVLGELGVHDEAESHLNEAVHLSQRLGLISDSCEGSTQLGLIAVNRQDFAAACAVLQTTVDQVASPEAGRFEAIALAYLALSRAQRGELEGVDELVARSLERGALEPATRAITLAISAKIMLLQGDATNALLPAESALQLMHDYALWEQIALLRLVQAESLLATGLTAQARRSLTEAVQWLTESATKIEDLELRRSFLSNIPAHVRLTQLARECCDGEQADAAL